MNCFDEESHSFVVQETKASVEDKHKNTEFIAKYIIILERKEYFELKVLFSRDKNIFHFN